MTIPGGPGQAGPPGPASVFACTYGDPQRVPFAPAVHFANSLRTPMRLIRLVILLALVLLSLALLATLAGVLGWLAMPLSVGLALFLLGFGLGKLALAMEGLVGAHETGYFARPWIQGLWIAFKTAAGLTALVAGFWLLGHPDAFQVRGQPAAVQPEGLSSTR